MPDSGQNGGNVNSGNSENTTTNTVADTAQTTQSDDSQTEVLPYTGDAFPWGAAALSILSYAIGALMIAILKIRKGNAR